MSRHRHLINLLPKLVLLIGLLGTSVAVSASVQGRTAQGWPYVSGGVSLEERDAMKASIAGNSLWLVTAASRSGHYLSDVQVLIRDSSQRVVFDQRLAGPWLSIDLPIGRYVVEAVFDGKTQRSSTTIQRGVRRQIVFHFDVKDDA